jgi:leucyl-tRNA synthetase
LRSRFYEFTATRDFYRDATRASRCGMHRDLVRRYAEMQALLVAPLAPHWAECIWREILGNLATINNASFPDRVEADAGLTATLDYIRTNASNVTSAQASQIKRLAKGKSLSFDSNTPFRLTVFCTMTMPKWQIKCVERLHNEMRNGKDRHLRHT